MGKLVWGASWCGGRAGQPRQVKAQCDNTAVVAMVNLGSSKESEAMLLRCLAFLQANNSFYIFATHIPRKT